MRFLFGALAFGFALSLAPTHVTAQSGASPEAALPIELRAYTNRTSYTLGEPVQFYLLLENVSDSVQQFSANLAMDEGLQVFITPAYQRPRRFIDRRSGVVLPNAISLDPGDIRGVYQHLHWSTLDGGSLAFPEPGMYRIDFGLTLGLYEDGRITSTQRVLADPVTIQVFEPLTEEEGRASEIMREPDVARAVQLRNPEDLTVPALERLLEASGGTVFEEHAHMLLGLALTQREEWIDANRHLYKVYEQEDWFYPKDMVLLAIMSNYHWAEEPERALGVCEVLLELYPDQRQRSHPLVNLYGALIDQRQQG